MTDTESLAHVISPATAHRRADNATRDGRAYAVVAEAHQLEDVLPPFVERHLRPNPNQETPEEAAARIALRNAKRNAAYTRRRPSRYAEASFDLLTEHQQQNGKIARWWDSGPRAVVLAGPARTGKTTAAYAIGNHTQAEHAWTLAWTAADLAAALKPDSDQPFAYEHATTCDLLILDDLGRERVTDWWLEQLQRILDARCVHERRLVVTTNHGTGVTNVYDELSTRYGYPIVERLIDDGAILFFDGPAVRRTVTEW